MDGTIVGIDVGTTKVCTLIGEPDPDGSIRIVGLGIVPSAGLHKGIVVNVDDATAAIAASLEEAEKISGHPIERAYVAVTGDHITSVNSRGTIPIGYGDHAITTGDVTRAIEAAQTIAIPHNRRMVHVIPRTYIVDGQDGVRDPVGMQAFRLEVEVHIVTAAVASLHNLVRCVERAGVEVTDLVLQPMAAAETALSSAERQMGVVLADIGGGTTDIAIYHEGTIAHTAALPVAGYQLTNDLAVVLRAPLEAAEMLKMRYGHAIPSRVDDTDRVDVAGFGDGGLQTVPRRYIAQVLEARTREVIHLISQETKRSGYDGLLPAGVVLCGGSTELPGLKELARHMLDTPVRVGTPQEMRGLSDAVSRPAYATSVGLLLWGMHHGADVAIHPNGRRPATANVLGRFMGWVTRAFFPQRAEDHRS
ncbi:MAG: Cell division protein FtsA [Anaerolineales bacterium]|nr:Cell division protein FtsA [Anaerolineales bacterium]